MYYKAKEPQSWAQSFFMVGAVETQNVVLVLACKSWIYCAVSGFQSNHETVLLSAEQSF